MGAIVTLQPRQPFADGRTGNGIVDEHAQFAIGFYDETDGAPAGDYNLLVYWPERQGGPSPDRLKGRYLDPQRPAAKVSVTASHNTLPELRLRSN